MSIGSMPTEELEQALLEAKWGSAEADVIDVIARLLEQPRAVVIRIAYALDEAHKSRTLPGYNPERELPEELREAIKAKLRRGLMRARVRQALLDGSALFAHPRSLIKKPRDICNGCPFSLACVTESYSTPEKCFKSGPPATIRENTDREPSVMRFSRGGAMVLPVQIRGDRVSVTSTHPYGTFDVDVEDLWA